MNHRWAELLAAETITAAATKTIDIDLVDPISRLSVLMKLTNNGATPTDHPAKALVKLEIVDGSDVLASLNGMEIQALNFYERNQPPFQELIYQDNIMTLMEFNINFGRHLWDKELAFDSKKFKNPQLKIQHSLALGGSAPDSMDLRVRCDVFDEDAPAPMGFLMPKEIYSYSLVSSGNEYIELPLDFPIRILMPLSRANGKAPYEQYNLLKLTEDMDKRVLLEGYTSDFQKVVAGYFGKYIETMVGQSSIAGVNHFMTPCFGARASLISDGQAIAIGYGTAVNGGRKLIYGASAVEFSGIFTGYCPHGAIAFPMGSLDDMDSWWDVSKLLSSRLKVTAGSSVESGSTMQLITQQLRKY